MSATHRFKRLVRPLIPDRIMARYRLRQHSRNSRVNVDVFVGDRRTAKRWLSTTPDTYRIRLDAPMRPPLGETRIVKDIGHEVDASLEDRARRLLAGSELGAIVVGETPEPHLVARRRAEPEVAPTLIATTDWILDEVGGVPRGEHPLPGLLARLRDGGHHIGLIPEAKTGAPQTRSDPIDRTPVVILAAVPLHDIGGGSRSTQLALGFLEQGFQVTLVSLYDAQESVDLGLRYLHADLEQYRVVDFDPDATIGRVSQGGLVLVEAPAEPLAGAAFHLMQAGWRLVYDMIDDWSDPALGGDWYSETVESELLARADAVIASAPDLVSKIEKSGANARLIPNAVNEEIFGVDLPPRPSDLPDAETIIGYHGSLYGDWFDWEQLRQVAEAFPEAAVVLIGDDKAPHPPMPENVTFLGLKPQTELPAYLQRFDVGIIPFEVSDTTHAVSPLKAYEYLGSGVPIAAPPLRALEGLDGLNLDADLVAAVRSALAGPRPQRRQVLEAHSWANRLESILNLVGIISPHPGLAATTRHRVAVHWPSSSRLIV